MSDLFAAAKVETPLAGKPKPRVRLWNGHLVHDCQDCGASNASFGEGVRLLKNEPGTWRCFPCQRIHVAKNKGG